MSLKTSPDQALPKGSLILVTGATGFIAANIIHEALENGYRIRGTARSQEKADQTIKLFNSPHYEACIVAEMEPKDAFDEAVKGVDAIIHAASPVTFDADPKKVVIPAVNGATSILNSALKEPSMKRFVYTSSSVAATLSNNGDETVYVDKKTWIKGFDKWADYPPPYDPENGFLVYIISKARAEQAVWDFVEEKKPHFVVNAVLPNFNIGRVIGNPGTTANIIQAIYTEGKVDWSFEPQYMINVIDNARLHLAAVFDITIANDRIFSFGYTFDFNQVLDILGELYPNKKFPEKKAGLKEDKTIVPNEQGVELLEKWWGQNGYTKLEESLKQNMEGL